jgi:hypothetical protein
MKRRETYAPGKKKKIKHENECNALHDLTEKAGEGGEWRMEKRRSSTHYRKR